MKQHERLAREARKRKAVADAEAAGQVADSMEARKSLIALARLEDWTLERLQSELKSLKWNAKKNGLLTREQVYRGQW